MSGLQAELNALVLGFQMAQNFGSASVTFYSDCAAAIWILQKGVRHGYLKASSLSLAFRLLAKNPGWKLRHILREENSYADALARKARKCGWSWANEDAMPLCSGGRGGINDSV